MGLFQEIKEIISFFRTPAVQYVVQKQVSGYKLAEYPVHSQYMNFIGAVERNDLDVVQQMINDGIDVNGFNPDDGDDWPSEWFNDEWERKYAICAASHLKDPLPMTRLLLQAGADPNKNEYGGNPINAAYWMMDHAGSDPEKLEKAFLYFGELLKAGAKPVLKYKDYDECKGQDMLREIYDHFSEYEERLKCLKRLVQIGVDPNTLDWRGADNNCGWSAKGFFEHHWATTDLDDGVELIRTCFDIGCDMTTTTEVEGIDGVQMNVLDVLCFFCAQDRWEGWYEDYEPEFPKLCVDLINHGVNADAVMANPIYKTFKMYPLLRDAWNDKKLHQTLSEDLQTRRLTTTKKRRM
ncbi:hypothetical protein [Pseudoxanthomonas winnipegensis]|uniref:Ankyrin repeat domain-containing protein n=1 Tax=Pseudoxanthomonas winnipegensis TaxID=2480810 RepID=A0A4Q8M359_9GAMM|nr:hypothetical protein [Pseudoxanthomonas winnipegensis]TAA41541.1 hypothetical protein EA655_11405 [Pseudoxanthomonas winnipegensis]